MRFLVLVKSDKDELPTTDIEAFNEMGAYIERLEREGVMLSAEGLHPSSEGARISLDGPRPVVTDGPFAETKELVGGFCIVQASSKEEIVKRILDFPFGRGGSVEIRRIFGAEDFAGLT